LNVCEFRVHLGPSAWHIPWKPEHGIEFNTLLDVAPMLLVQPVIQYYANVGGGTGRAVVFGFRTKVEF